jgi:hypothetical protein
MSLFTIDIILNFSIVFAVVIGIFRFKSILKTFYPLVLFVCLGLANEILSLFLIIKENSYAVNSNIYVLIEFIILLWQFYKWNNSYFRTCFITGVIGILVWITDNVFINSITDDNSIFRIYYSFVIVFFSIDLLNKAIINEKENILKNAVFLACAGFLAYYGLKVLLEVFNSFKINFNNSFYIKIWLTLSVANCIANIIYAIAILCIPKKQEFFLQY